MIDIPDKVFSSAERAFLLANTPGYLYRNLRDIKWTRKIAREVSAEELVNQIDKIDNIENPNLEDIVTAYIFLVSLTYHKPEEVFKSLRKLEVNSLNWIGDIISIWNNHRKSSNTLDISSPQPTSLDVDHSESGSIEFTSHQDD
jgi:ribosome biogenesis GTPase A